MSLGSPDIVHGEALGTPATHAATLGLLGTFFFVSGASALLYQVVWERSLSLVYGSNVESVTLVIGAFMLGLGLGSLAGGWLAARFASLAVLAFAAFELGIGLFGLVSLQLFRTVGAATIEWSLVAVAPVMFALLLVPTLLMGATLPLLVAHMVSRSTNVGASVGRLYFVNTLGAATGALLAAAWLLRTLGQQGSVWLAAGLNIAVALGAFAFSLRRGAAR